jgi:hypothetical protein
MYSHLALSENGFLFDSQSGKTFSLNPTGVFLMNQLINGEKPTALRLLLVTAFDVDPDRASRDVDEFVLRLLDLHILINEEEKRCPA